MPPPRPTALCLLVLLGVALGAAGCAAETEGGPDGSRPAPGSAAAAPTPAGSRTAQTRRLEITVTGGRVDPEPGRIEVSRGATVLLTVTSDVPDELHVHGFGDPEVELVAGRPATLELLADEPGLYEVETHETDLLLTQILVR